MADWQHCLGIICWNFDFEHTSAGAFYSCYCYLLVIVANCSHTLTHCFDSHFPGKPGLANCRRFLSMQSSISEHPQSLDIIHTHMVL